MGWKKLEKKLKSPRLCHCKVVATAASGASARVARLAKYDMRAKASRNLSPNRTKNVLSMVLFLNKLKPCILQQQFVETLDKVYSVILD